MGISLRLILEKAGYHPTLTVPHPPPCLMGSACYNMSLLCGPHRGGFWVALWHERHHRFCSICWPEKCQPSCLVYTPNCWFCSAGCPPQAWGDSLSVFGGHGLSCWSYCNSITMGGLKHGTILFSSAGGQERGPCPSFSSLPLSLHIPACMTTWLRLKCLLFNLFLFSDFSIFLKQSLTV